MLFIYLLSSALAIGFTSASPLTPTRTLVKRAAGTPQIAPGFTTQQKNQLLNAFMNANELADYGVTSADTTVFGKYYPGHDLPTVKNVLKKIFDNNTPNPTLSAITVSTDFPNADKILTCTNARILAALRDATTDNPTMIICPNAFKFGGINKGFPGVAAVNCDSIGDTVSYKMDMLGGTILHEYTHWMKLTNPPLTQQVIDQPSGYGPYNTQHLSDKTLAIYNADSYNWYTIQNFWTVTCPRTFNPPTADGAKDPRCDNLVCQYDP